MLPTTFAKRLGLLGCVDLRKPDLHLLVRTWLTTACGESVAITNRDDQAEQEDRHGEMVQAMPRYSVRMCNRYVPPEMAAMERYWHVGPHNNNPWRGGGVYPRAPGPFIRRARHDAGYSRELVVGQWGLIPWFAKDTQLSYSTNNARSEELASKASFKDPWKCGQRCIIPAESFDEPYWGPYDNQFKKCEWWTFRRKDGEPWGLAGLWNVWVDKATGEEIESYTMLTINADGHPLMGKMHKNGLDPATKQPLPLALQDKRSVIPIASEDVDQWLTGTIDEAKSLLRVPAAELFEAGPIAAI